MINPPTSLKIEIVNASPEDIAFLRNVVAVFSDPKNSKFADLLRAGRSNIQYTPGGGLTVSTSKPQGPK